MPLKTSAIAAIASGRRRYRSLRQSLVAYWPLNETAASGDVTAEDWTGRGNNLTSNNSVLSTTGKVNNAREFVRSNSEWLSVTSADLNLGEIAWTLAFWFFVPTGATNSRFNILGKDVSGSRHFVVAFNFEATGANTTNALAFQYYRTDGGASIVNLASVSRNAWHFASMTHALNSSSIVCNLDRASSLTLTRTGAQTWASPNSAFNVGRREFSGFNDYADCSVDEVAVWHRELSSTELDTLYNSGSGVDLRE
jgi:hypothetical protein